ncbi:hypothetical protein IE53DRAFT_381230 [Violaceomyces palustris]|uniref:Uncharacterized protein n=1 Tax=Violaceomyces palustris TaxID=1673888 RepID=A0ACD0NRW8_9BASI|nr:hypothetical protein IE53DRAFT_381230 [Violaceomyces palustris]
MDNKIQLGVAAMDRKARSKPMQNILNRLISTREFEVVNFGDKVILDEEIENWPIVDVLISFFSTGFPLDKAIAYVDLRKPILVNDLRLQKVLWDRRAVLSILDSVGVRTPFRIEVDRDGGPEVEERVASDLKRRLNIDFSVKRETKDCYLSDYDTLVINGQEMKKPYVEKPVSGEDHNIHIYFPKSRGGGGRRLFRKVGNKSSEFDPDLSEPRKDGSYIYEQFMDVDNAEDIKVYTIGPYFVHAETRKSPVVDGLVKRNPDGKEIRYITKLSKEEIKMATDISKAFKQNICGFDLLRVGDKSYVIDVNGWSFVKGNDFYYDKCAEILGKFCRTSVLSRPLPISGTISPKERERSSWTLKANVTVFRHGDRTPKQKLKRSFKAKDAWTAPLIELLQGRREEIILRQNLDIVSRAAEKASALSGANVDDLKLVIQVIERKKDLPGTKVQMKPNFSKETGELDKMQLIIKWGGEFSHAARHQAKDFGQNMRRDMVIMNEAALSNCTVYTSSERRVTASAEIFAAAFLDDPNSSGAEEREMIIRKDLLDDSNAAKDLMDAVKKKLKQSLKPDGPEADFKPDDWPEDLPSPARLGGDIAQLLQGLRETMRDNFARLNVDKIQSRWCTHETPALFKERWEKLFNDFEEEPNDPSRSSELYDMLSHDGLHNRTFIETIFADPKVEGPSEQRLAKLHELYRKSLALFSFVCPREYGITPEEKEEIGLLTSMPLLKNVVEDLRSSQDVKGLCSLYFTKESHIHTLLNLVLCSDLPVIIEKPPPLDYFASITFEVYERTSSTYGGGSLAGSTVNSASQSPAPSSLGGNHSGVNNVSSASSVHSSDARSDTEAAGGERGSASSGGATSNDSSSGGSGNGGGGSGGGGGGGGKYSLLISVSEGAHSSNILSINLDARHALTPLPRRPLTTHMDLDEALAKLSAHSLRFCEGGEEAAADELAKRLDRGQVEGSTVFFGLEDPDRQFLPIKQRRESLDTDRGSVRFSS